MTTTITHTIHSMATTHARPSAMAQSVHTWSRNQQLPQDHLSVELKKRAEYWIEWEGSSGPLFLSDICLLPLESLHRLSSDMKILLASLNAELSDLYLALDGCGPNQQMASQDIKIKIKKIKGKKIVAKKIWNEAIVQRKQTNKKANAPRKKTLHLQALTISEKAQRQIDAQTISKKHTYFKNMALWELLKKLVDSDLLASIETESHAQACDKLAIWLESQGNMDIYLVKNYLEAAANQISKQHS